MLNLLRAALHPADSDAVVVEVGWTGGSGLVRAVPGACHALGGGVTPAAPRLSRARSARVVSVAVRDGTGGTLPPRFALAVTRPDAFSDAVAVPDLLAVELGAVVSLPAPVADTGRPHTQAVVEAVFGTVADYILPTNNRMSLEFTVWVQAQAIIALKSGKLQIGTLWTILQTEHKQSNIITLNKEHCSGCLTPLLKCVVITVMNALQSLSNHPPSNPN